jgi:broad specificity phosphatase PhoE
VTTERLVTTTFFLVRHAVHDRGDTMLCGRTRGVALGAPGREQARCLAERFAGEDIAAVRTSPLERARSTAERIAARVRQPLELCEAITEIDFGAWSGLTFDELARDPRWSAWNAARSFNRPPRGETMLDVQARIVGAIDELRSAYPDRAIVLVSHGDVIKAALLYHLGMPIDSYGRFDIAPASISTLVVGDWGARVVRLNEVVTT